MLGKVSRRTRALVKDYVPSLSMPVRHTLEADGASAPALFPCRGGDGKRLTGSDTEAARCRVLSAQTGAFSEVDIEMTAVDLFAT